MAKALDSKAYIAALEDLIARLEPAAFKAFGESDRALFTLAKANIAARKARDEADSSSSAHVDRMCVFPLVREWVLKKPMMSVRLVNALYNALPEETIIDLLTCTIDDIKNVPNIGKISLKELQDRLAEHGLRLGMTREEAEAAYKAS